ncbi:MAG TPA: hypothetical protein VG028_04090 [Terriglobia bacterium]|nr:hypothetical protein [Terriglobia bacterium]
MAEVYNYYPGDLATALDRAMTWMLSRQNANVSPFVGNAVATPTSPAFIEGAMDPASGTLDALNQVPWPNIVLDPVFGIAADLQAGPDGFPINYSATPLLSGNLLVNVLALTATTSLTGRVLNLVLPASQYRVDVYSRTDVFYYQGSSLIAADNTWALAGVHAGTVIAFLMPASSTQPAAGSSTSLVSGWTSHSNLGVGNKLADYFIRVYAKTDIEYLQEDQIPILVQDSTHARFGSSVVPAAGTLTAHMIYNDPVLGPVDLYSTLQNEAVYADLPRSIEVPPGDPDYASPGVLASSNTAYIQNRCWIYDAALSVIAFAVAGLWDAAQRIVTRLNNLRANPGYLPSLILEDAQDGSIARWSLVSGAGTAANVFDATEPPAQSGGSNVISITASTAPASWNFIGSGLPDAADSIIECHYLAGVDFTFAVGVTSSRGQVTTINLASTGTAGYNSGSKTITSVLGLAAGVWRVFTQNLNSLIAQYVAGETLVSITSFKVIVQTAGNLRLDNLSVGTPQPAGSLSFSYDVYNGQVDQAYIRSGSVAWVAYAYGVYMERTGDYLNAALGLQSMLNFLFSLQSSAADLRKNLITLGWGMYQDPGYQYVPGPISTVSTEHNIDCYFAFDKAARVLPSAAVNLLNRELITAAQYSSLIATATQAATVAGQISAALLAQIWIPPSGPVKGHFAQGASSTGLDTSLALDCSGTWGAMFCHEVGDDVKAVSCLEFIFETFFLANQQITLSALANSFNQTYQQLTPFDGFKTYADSAGGYSGSPASVWMEGTWGALAAYLRLSGNADLQAYFSGNYAGGLSAFLGRLAQSLGIVGSTTGDGVLSFSLGARALPWEFSLRKTMASTAWFWITGTRNDVLFTSTSSDLSGRPYLKIPRGVQQTIRPLDGQSSIGALELEATDGGGYMTALVSKGKLEGRKISLRVGYPGMNSSDFVTVATQEIDSILGLPDLTGYALHCRDLTRSAKTKIFLHGDDGMAVSRDHARTLQANPMDVLLMVFQNELGMGQSPSLPPTAWRIYDPTQWNSATTSNPTLISPNPSVDVDTILSYRNDIFAGCVLEFSFPQPVEAKQFLEFEILKALGGYLIVLADGRLSPRFMVPPYSFVNLFAFNERNITVLPGITRQPIINQVTYRLDYDGSQFQQELLFLDAPSLEQYGLAGQDIIESKGLRSARGGVSLAGLTATRIFRRYNGVDPVSGSPRGGAPTAAVTSQYMTLTVEAGDFAFLSHPLMPNFETGRRGVFNQIVEITDKQPNYRDGSMAYQLLDSGWMSGKILSRIAPSGTPAFASASSYQRTRYAFMASNSTMTFSDGTAPKTIY